MAQQTQHPLGIIFQIPRDGRYLLSELCFGGKYQGSCVVIYTARINNGSNAVVLVTQTFVTPGFVVAIAIKHLSWIQKNTVDAFRSSWALMVRAQGEIHSLKTHLSNYPTVATTSCDVLHFFGVLQPKVHV